MATLWKQRKLDINVVIIFYLWRRRSYVIFDLWNILYYIIYIIYDLLCRICFGSISNTMVYRNDIHNWSWLYASIKRFVDRQQLSVGCMSCLFNRLCCKFYELADISCLTVVHALKELYIYSIRQRYEKNLRWFIWFEFVGPSWELDTFQKGEGRRLLSRFVGPLLHKAHTPSWKPIT